MPGHDQRLTQWWEGLSEEERVDALAASKSGKLSDGLRQSLHSSGLSQPAEGQTERVIPAPVDDFLRMRHDPS